MKFRKSEVLTIANVVYGKAGSSYVNLMLYDVKLLIAIAYRDHKAINNKLKRIRDEVKNK